MQKEQIKKISGNIITVLVIVAVFVVGYFSFVKKDTTVATAPVVSTSDVADQVVLASSQVDDTIKNLRDLNGAVEKSMVFGTPAFTTLQDFSVQVSQEPIGRPDPFVPTDWKLAQKSK